MSARRRARARGATTDAHRGTFPALLSSRTHDGWDDRERIEADFADLMRPADQFRLSLHPRSLYNVLLNRWATANGYDRDGRADWRELRATELIERQTS